MKRFWTLALLASAALPVAAHAQEDGERPRTGAERREAAAVQVAQRGDRGDRPRFQGGNRGERPVQADRGPRPDRSQFDRGARSDQRSFTPPPATAAQAPDAGNRGFRGRDGDRGGWRGDLAGRGYTPAPSVDAGVRDQQRRDWNGHDNRGGANDGRRWDNNDRRWNGNDRGWNDNRGGWNGNDRRWNDNRGNWNGNNGRNWDRGWRNDRRYDWQGYRNSNRNAYRLPRYYGPSGWNYGYRRFSIGATLFSGLFAQNYWINDPFSYRLPPAGWPYQWVRYYDDALLVDTRSGFVVDVIPGIFW